MAESEGIALTKLSPKIRPAKGAAGSVGLVCPACRSPLREHGDGWDCRGCRGRFPRVAGLPDLRLRSDRYLGLAAERAKAERLATLARGGDVHQLAAAYYDMTPDVDASRRRRFLAHIAGAERRGAALAALLPRDGRILEVGCGTGGLLAAGNGRCIVGVDIALRWLVVARRRLEDRGRHLTLVAADANLLPWPDGHFDAVVADSVLEHLDEPGAALAEWARVVRPGGTLVVWSPNRWSLGPDPHVGLWGVGWLPRRLAGPYARLRGRKGWTVRPLGAGEAAGLLDQRWGRVNVGPADVGRDIVDGPAGRLGLRVYRSLLKFAPCHLALTRIGPLWQMVATRGEPA